MIRRIVTAIVLTVAAAGLVTPAATAASKGDGSYDTWSWFKDTYWIVPENGIFSVLHSADTGQFSVIRGQTVFHITDYFNGYWTGAVVVKITGAQVPSCQQFSVRSRPRGWST